MASNDKNHPSHDLPEKTCTTATSEEHTFAIVALYKFVDPLLDEEVLPMFRVDVETAFRQQGARGLILLAREGINGTISCPLGNVSAIQSFLEETLGAGGFQYRQSTSANHIFPRFKLKVRTEIVTLGRPDVRATPDQVGTYVHDVSTWNALLQDPKTLVIDTRNEYEVAMGTFANSVNPHTQSFTEFPEWFQQTQLQQQPNPSPSFQQIAMFCTGGIRCEKASSYCTQALHAAGMDNVPVYHFKGGILAYLDQVAPEDSLWSGECYVFDQRVAVTYKLQPTTEYTACYACRHPLSKAETQHPHYQVGISCGYCYHNEEKQRYRQRYVDRQKQIELCQQRNMSHFRDPKQIRADQEQMQERNSTLK